ALRATRDDAGKRQRFVDALLKGGAYRNATAVEADLKKYTLRLDAYNFFNESNIEDADGKLTPLAYGYARLDAFGRIYNRVLEHVLNGDTLSNVLTNTVPPEDLDNLLRNLQPVLSQENRDDVMEQLSSLLTPE